MCWWKKKHLESRKTAGWSLGRKGQVAFSCYFWTTKKPFSVPSVSCDPQTEIRCSIDCREWRSPFWRRTALLPGNCTPRTQLTYSRTEPVSSSSRGTCTVLSQDHDHHGPSSCQAWCVSRNVVFKTVQKDSSLFNREEMKPGFEW